MRKVVGLLVMLVVLASLVAPVSACVNDEDTMRQERQFKSLYPDSPASPSPQPEIARQQDLAYGFSGLGGLALLSTAGYMGLVRRTQ